MVLNRVWLAAFGATVLAWSGLSAAQQYRADEYLNLDLSRAVLSPKPLGPAASFAPGPLDVAVNPKFVSTATVHADNNSRAKIAIRTAASGMRAVHAQAERSAPHKLRALVALHARNPVDAQARETRVQVWPCKSGGICDWKR